MKRFFFKQKPQHQKHACFISDWLYDDETYDLVGNS